MSNHKDKIVTFVLGITACGIIIWALGPIAHAYFSTIKEISKWESKENCRYVYAIPNTSLFLQTYFYNDSLCTIVGKDTIINNGSHFSVRYFSDLTLVLLEVINDTLVYLVDHNNDIDSIYNKSVIIEHIPSGFNNSKFYDKQYTEDSRLYYEPKFPRVARISLYSGKVIMNDSVVSPIEIKYKTMVNFK